MKTSKQSDSQIMAILQEAEAGTPVHDLCREHGMSSATFYWWRFKIGGMDTSLMKCLKELEDANRRLKKMYAGKKDTPHEYRTGFAGMTEHAVSLDEVVSARQPLITGVRKGLTDEHKKFLISFYRRRPEWELLPRYGLDRLPAVKWREMNLDRAGTET